MSSNLTSSDASELARLRAYVAEYQRMIRQHDRSLPRWRHYHTEWLWLYLRGMIAGDSPLSVKRRRLAEPELDRAQAKSEEAGARGAETRAASAKVVRFARIEMFGGPADGQVQFVSLPIADARTAHAISSNGKVVKPSYRRPQGEIGDIVALKPQSLGVPHAELEKAFAGESEEAVRFDRRPAPADLRGSATRRSQGLRTRVEVLPSPTG